MRTVGLRFAIPAGWSQQESLGATAFTSPDGLASVIIAVSDTTTAGRTAEDVINEQLAVTLGTSLFDPNVLFAPTGTVDFAGWSGYGTGMYTYKDEIGGIRVSRYDRAVVLPGYGEYYCAFLANEAAYKQFAGTLNTIMQSMEITRP